MRHRPVVDNIDRFIRAWQYSAGDWALVAAFVVFFIFLVYQVSLHAKEKVPPPRNVCTDCKTPVGGQHKPSCHRQGLVTVSSVYHA